MSWLLGQLADVKWLGLVALLALAAGLAMAGFSLAREDQLGLLWAIALELFGAGLAVLSLHDTD